MLFLLILKYDVLQTLSHVDTVFSEGSNSDFVKDNVLQLSQDILIIPVSVIQHVVIFSSHHF